MEKKWHYKVQGKESDSALIEQLKKGIKVRTVLQKGTDF